MKKVFVEPKMQRIELNLRENIAASGGPEEDPDSSIHIKLLSETWNVTGCTVQYTGKLIFNCNESDLQSCIVRNINTRSAGSFLPLEEALPYIRR